MGKAMHVWEKRVYGKSLYFSCYFIVNINLEKNLKKGMEISSLVWNNFDSFPYAREELNFPGNSFFELFNKIMDSWQGIRENGRWEYKCLPY